MFWSHKLISKIVLSMLGLSIFMVPHAEASCGSANCFLVTGTTEGIETVGRLTLDLSYRWIPMDQVHRGSKSASEALVPAIDFENGVIEPDHHQEARTNNELMQLDVGIGVTKRFSGMLSIPFFNLRTHEHADGPEFSRQDGTSGFGDIRLIGKYALWVSTKHLLVGGLGIKTPSGEYKLLDHDGEINEPTIQPGTGSWDGIVSAYYAYQVIPHELDAFLSTSYQIATENPLDYKMGDTLLANGGASYRLAEKWTTSLQANLRYAPADEFKGEEVPSTGGTWIYLTPGIKTQASPNTALYAHIQFPLYQRVNDVNIVPRYQLIVGVSHAF